jgi:putative protease
MAVKKKATKKVVKKTKKVVNQAKRVVRHGARKVVKKVTKKTVKKGIKKTKKIVKKVVSKAIVLKPKKIDGKKVGVVTHWFGNIHVAIFKLSAPLSVGDKIKIVRGETEVDDLVSSMQMNHEAITSAKKGMEVGVKLKEEVHEGADVYVM